MANSIATGVAYADPSFQTLNVTGATTLDGNVALGNAAADLVAAHGATACDQSDTCSALSTSAAIIVSGTVVYGFATQAQADAIATAVNLIRTCLREKGWMA